MNTASLLLVAAFGMGTLALAQNPTLRETARTFALGGACERIEFAPDGVHLLTVGEHGDVCWWDLTAGTLVRRFEPRGRWVTAAAIHPKEPWAAIGISVRGQWDGAVFRFDFATGDVRRVHAHYVVDLAFDADGGVLGAVEVEVLGEPRQGQCIHRLITIPTAQLDGTSEPIPTQCIGWAPWSGRCRVAFPGPDGRAEMIPMGDTTGEGGKPCRSREGKATGRGRRSEVRRLTPMQQTYSLEPFVDTWIERTAIGDDGTLAAADLQGQLFVMAPGAAKATVHAGHLGAAHRLVFSPDGRVLAIAGLGAVRFVDLAGKEIATREGTQVVVPGTAGAEFFLMTRTEWRRWNAAVPGAPEIVEKLGAPFVPVFTTNFQTRPLDILRSPAPDAVFGPQALWTLAPVVAVDGQPWCASEHNFLRSPAPVRLTLEGRMALPSHAREVGLMNAAQVLPNGHVALSWGSQEDDDFGRAGGVVRLYDRRGDALGAVTVAATPIWLCPAGDDLLLGTTDGAVRRLHGRDLTVAKTSAFTPPLLQVEPFGPGRLLATNGPSLQLLDAESLAVVHTFVLPAGFDGVDVFGLAPDRAHLALARRADVRLLTIVGR